MFKRFSLGLIVLILMLAGVVSAQEGGDEIELTQEFSYFEVPVGFMLPEDWVVVDENEAFDIIIFANSEEMADSLNQDTPPDSGIFGAVSIVENNEVADATELLDNTLGSLGYSEPPETTFFDLTEDNPAARFEGELETEDLSTYLHVSTIASGNGFVTLYLFSFDGEQTALFDAILASLDVAPELTQELTFGIDRLEMSLPTDWATVDMLDTEESVLFASSQEFLDTALTTPNVVTFEDGMLGYIEFAEDSEATTAEVFLTGYLADNFDLEAVEIVTSEDESMSTYSGEVDTEELQAYIHVRAVKTDVGYIVGVLISFEGEQDALFGAVMENIELDFN